MTSTSPKEFVSLKVAAEGKVDGVGKTTNFAVDPRIILVKPGFNPRPLDMAQVESMAASLAGGAIFPPLEVWVEAGAIYVADGHHRLAAAMLAIERGTDLKSLDVRQFRGSDADRIALTITANNGRQLLPLELGLQCMKLLRLGWQEADIAARIGYNVDRVRDVLRLAEADTSVQDTIRKGEISGSLAIDIIKQEGSKATSTIKKAVDKAKAEGKKKATAKHVDTAPRFTKRELAIVEHILAKVNETRVTKLTAEDVLEGFNG